MNPKVDAFLSEETKWRPEMERLRAIALNCGLTEELKWGKPAYTHDGQNVVLIQGFKDYCALLFFKGVLLKDPKGILIQQTENVQAARQIRFTKLDQVTAQEKTLKAYVRAAIELEKSGAEVTYKGTTEYAVPAEFQKRLNADPALKAAFKALTPGRQRGYLFYFSGAKQSQTREARVEKCAARILEGLGLDD